MADEPRRSGRATKGQHKNASSSPAPQPKPTKKSKPPKKSVEAEADDDDGEETIRCICGNSDPKDKRAFIGCDSCEAWQHNVCMGEPEDEEDVPDHYFCEECAPDAHRETLQALARGEPIWETRTKIWQSEKKASRNRKSKGGQPGWLKRDMPDGEPTEDLQDTESQEAGSKRKREEVKEEPPQDAEAVEVEKLSRASRQEKRRKPGRDVSADPETALVDIDKLPADRKKIAEALSKIIADEVSARAKSGSYRIPDGHTAKSLGDYHASRIEYGLKMNHEKTGNEQYMGQFRTLVANLKKNKLLIERLLEGSLTADELSTMNSKDMASEELQKERAVMKEQLDRQAVAIKEEGPRYRRTHKGDELIEDENKELSGISQAAAQPVRERTSLADADDGGSPAGEQTGSPMQADSPAPLKIEPRRQSSAAADRKSSGQQFNMKEIWDKTAQSPTSATGVRPMQMPPRRMSSVPQHDGTKEDADVDRMLQDEDDDTYSPAEYTAEDTIVWRGKLLQSADSVVVTVNARFVAGRDLARTVPWHELLPAQLGIDGRLQVAKAEEYLCSLQNSSKSDVSVLAFTPYDDPEGFEAVFSYFKTRERYAVVNKDTPPMVKDLYIIPVDAGQDLPPHVSLLVFNRLGTTVPEKCLLATFVVFRAAGPMPVAEHGQADGDATNGQITLPQHMRAGGAGPAGSPLNTTSATFSPPSNNHAQLPITGYTGGSLPPNPYGHAQPPPGSHNPQGAVAAPPPHPVNPSHPNYPLINQVLGSLQYAPSAQQVIAADPNIAREKLEHLKQIMEADPITRTDIVALGHRLFAGS